VHDNSVGGLCRPDLEKREAQTDLSFEQPSKFELLINLNAAMALGLTVPHSFLPRAYGGIQQTLGNRSAGR